MREITARVGRRAFRRPLTSEELEAFAGFASTVAADAGPLERGGEALLLALLQSHGFLYMVDVGAAQGPFRQLTGYELATRLSFFLVGTIPDDALLDAAERGEPDSAEGIRRHARALLSRAEAGTAATRFFGELLRLRAGPADERREPVP